MTLRGRIIRSDHPLAKSARRMVRASRSISIPVPRVITRPALMLYLVLREGYVIVVRLFFVEPLFKAACTRVGKRFRAGQFMPWIAGSGEIVLGDDVRISGKITIGFAARFSERPQFHVGNGTGLSHQCEFIIGKRITIGSNCRIAGRVRMADSHGHPIEPGARLRGDPPEDHDVRAITIGNNVWLGTGATIMPGVSIGDHSVVAAGSIVTKDVPACTVVAGIPARIVSTFAPPA